MKYNMSGSSTHTMTQTRYYAAANALNNAISALKSNDKNKVGFRQKGERPCATFSF